MCQEDEWFLGIFLFGNRTEPDHVLHEQPEAAYSEICKVFRGESRAAVSAVIVAVDNQTRLCQDFDETEVPSDVLAETVRNLDDAAAGPSAVPPATRYG